MVTTQLLKYTKSIIEDDYAMDVLFYSVAKAIADNGHSLKGLNYIKISKKFVPEEIVINLNHRFSTPEEAFAILLSLKALILNKEWIDYCHNDLLLFEASSSRPFGWVVYASLIMDCMSDDEFSDLYYMLEAICADGSLSEEDKEKFASILNMPECRNLPNYYRDVASSKTGATDEVICNNAFVCDDSMTEYNVPESIAYIGNTAFAYCGNLKEICFNNKETSFGKFPIIECEKLSRIMVPEGSELFYKEALPFYKNIIFTEKSLTDYNESKAQILQSIKMDILPQESQDVIEQQHQMVPATEAPKEQVGTQSLKVSSSASSVTLEVSSSKPAPIKQNVSIEPKSLKNVFDKKVTSYKYFWLMSIISLISEKQELTISFEDLVIRMASLAWPLVFTDELDFGSRDMMKSYLSDVQSKSTLISGSTKTVVESYLKNNYEKGKVNKLLAPLLKNVPYRFLSPWIKYVSDDDVIAKSNSSTYNGPYAIHDKSIIMDEDWFDYIINNYDDVHKFVKDEFTAYLKQYNNPLTLIRFIADKSF